MKKLIIEVRSNENAMRAVNRHVPWTPSEIAADAASCVNAGASIVHYHARTDAGAADHSPSAYDEIASRIRAACDILIAPSLANRPGATAEQRFSNLLSGTRSPHTKADFLTVEPGSTNMTAYDRDTGQLRGLDAVFVNSFETVNYMLDAVSTYGMHPYLTSFNVSWTRAVEALLDTAKVPVPAFLLLVHGGKSFIAAHPGTLEGLEAHLRFLPPQHQIEWAVACHGANVLSLAAIAIEKGGHVSIGLGDHPYTELGEPTNAELVEEVTRLARNAGREVASPAEVKQMLKMI